jgi:hypothetical protein
MVRARQKINIKRYEEAVVELSNSDVTFDSRRLLPAEIDKPPLSTSEKLIKPVNSTQ